MQSRTIRIIIYTLILLVMSGGCKAATERPVPAPDEVPVILEEGSSESEPRYFEETERNPGFPPVFPGSQRIYPSGEDPLLRESYITQAPYEAVEQFYRDYLAHGDAEIDGEESDHVSMVNSSTLRDEDGTRQTGLFINDSDEYRGGMKVMLKEFPVQHSVQIILTTLEATPFGLNPLGMYISPEELDEIAEDVARQEEEEERRRAEIEEQAVDSPGVREAGESDDENSEDSSEDETTDGDGGGSESEEEDE